MAQLIPPPVKARQAGKKGGNAIAVLAPNEKRAF